MAADFDANEIAVMGWRQGAVLGPELRTIAWGFAPKCLTVDDESWLIVTSHDCDVVNLRFDREPFVEVIRAVVLPKKADASETWGRNPRTLQLEVSNGGGVKTVLAFNVHERWPVQRQFLLKERPDRCLPDKSKRAIAEWLAKRYIRAAFPGAFDARWRKELKGWSKLMRRHSSCIQGVYLRLNTLDELEGEMPYKIDVIVAAPASVGGSNDWPLMRETIEDDVRDFWTQFAPGIEFVDVLVTGTDELTLAEIEPYQRFDLDWVSFLDDSPALSLAFDMKS